MSVGQIGDPGQMNTDIKDGSIVLWGFDMYCHVDTKMKHESVQQLMFQYKF